ncbi:glycoside hydrolase family 16 protein [Planctomycetota bacterium]|nr:glycoside hydrolase family 16 protein [Planctomycetota bacterium]
MQYLSLCLLALSIIAAPLSAQQQTPPTQDKQWKLVWSDEFNYTGLPDSEKWDYEHGFIRNNEPQYYTKARKQNALVSDGVLTITGIKEQYPNAKYNPESDNWRHKQQHAQYTSASLITLHKAHHTYGRVEVRAQLPQGKGVWPAIWMMGINRPQLGWPKCGEIDIMEFVGKDPSKIHATVHYPIDDPNNKYAFRSKSGNINVTKIPPFNDFHVYAMNRYPDRMEFYFDDTHIQTFYVDTAGKGPENPFRKPHYLLINLALGGSWGGPIDDTILPQKYIIDYVRFYEPIEPQPSN